LRRLLETSKARQGIDLVDGQSLDVQPLLALVPVECHDTPPSLQS
jgi:hypothetical protein